MLVLTDDQIGIGGFIGHRQRTQNCARARLDHPCPSSYSEPIGQIQLWNCTGPAGFNTVLTIIWRDTQEAEIQATGLAPTNDLESAILATFGSGYYTAYR
jgi:hypothetical protein